MGHPVLGNPNRKFRAGGMRGWQSSASSCSDTPNGVPTGSSRTFIQALAFNEVAVVHRIELIATLDAAATNVSLIVSCNGSTMEFVSRGSATAPTKQNYTMNTRGNLVVTPHATPGTAAMTATASANGAWQMRVVYQVMRTVDAIQAGYLRGVPFVATVGGTGSAAPIDLITAATVTASRGLEVSGFVISGTNQSAAAAAPLTTMIGFWDGATERKLFSNFYATTNILASPQVVVSRGLFRGPKGFGIRGTFGENSTNGRIAIWGFFYTEDQKTWPGTGVPPASATGAFTGGEYFWLYTEQTANPSAANWFPTTTVADKQPQAYTIDGVACSVAANSGSVPMLSVGYTDNAKSILHGVELNAQTAAGAISHVMEDLDVRTHVQAPIAFAHRDVIGATLKACMLSWGRFNTGGDTLSNGHRADALHEVV